MSTEAREIILHGLPLSHGIAIGVPHFFSYREDEVPEYSIDPESVQSEIQRYRLSLEACRKDLLRLQVQMDIEGAVEASSILDTHLQIMRDPLLTQMVEDEIRKIKKNAEYVFHKLVDAYNKRFQAITDPFFRERSKDLKDIARRIMGDLKQCMRHSFADIPAHSIVVLHDLASSDAAEAKSETIGAFVAAIGTPTSHASIVAKAKGIPYVANIDISRIEAAKHQAIIVDGRTGDVIINPSSKTLKHYKNLQSDLSLQFELLQKTAGLEASTKDGHRIKLSANVEMVSELEKLHQYGGDGIGLFRSEYIFLTKQSFPEEEEQFAIYKKIAEKMGRLPVVIRSFDVGGDKNIFHERVEHEINPYMGCRAIRFLLKEREIFKTQLRAIIRAAEFGNVSILFPMISCLGELLETKELIEEVKAELTQKGLYSGKKIPIGCMIEVPSAAIITDHLAEECDFLSIGTNDLVQYSLAADRGNQALSELYSPTHPGILRLIQMVLVKAKEHNTPVAVCGEVAADQRFTQLLIGLGVDELSVSPRYIPVIKQAIRSCTIVDAIKFANHALKLKTAAQVDQFLNQDMEEPSVSDKKLLREIVSRLTVEVKQ